MIKQNNRCDHKNVNFKILIVIDSLNKNIKHEFFDLKNNEKIKMLLPKSKSMACYQRSTLTLF